MSENDSKNDTMDGGVGRCDNDGCHRDAVVTHRFENGEERAPENDFCLPCYRVLRLAIEIPWEDESAEWHDWSAFKERWGGWSNE